MVPESITHPQDEPAVFENPARLERRIVQALWLDIDIGTLRGCSLKA